MQKHVFVKSARTVKMQKDNKSLSPEKILQ